MGFLDKIWGGVVNTTPNAGDIGLITAGTKKYRSIKNQNTYTNTSTYSPQSSVNTQTTTTQTYAPIITLNSPNASPSYTSKKEQSQIPTQSTLIAPQVTPLQAETLVTKKGTGAESDNSTGGGFLSGVTPMLLIGGLVIVAFFMLKEK